MGKSSPAPPPAPDPTVVDTAQSAANKDTANYQSVLNNTNVKNPYGTVDYTQAPSGQWTQTTTLSPAEQAIFNGQTAAEGAAMGVANQQIGRVGQALSQNLTAPTLQTSYGSGGPIQYGYSSGGPIQTSVGPQNIGADLAGEVGTQYGAQMQLLQPQLQQQTEQTQAQLVAQGLNPNDAAYQNAMTLMGNQQAAELGQAASNAVNLGNTEQNTLFGQSLSQGEFANAAQAQGNAQAQQAAAFNNTAQQQANAEAAQAAQFYNNAQQQTFQNQAYTQELPINEFSALLGSGQVQAPTSTPAQTSVAPTNVLGAYDLQQTGLQNNYAAQMQNSQSGLGGLFSLGSAALNFL